MSDQPEKKKHRISVSVRRVLPGPTPPPEATQKLDDLPVPAQVESYAVLGVNDRDIATRLRCSVEQLRNSYSTELAVGRARRRITLRQLQWKQATEGSVNILTLLGKCELGQADGPEEETAEKVIVCRTTPRDKPPAD